MSGHFWLIDEQIARLWPVIPKSQGKPRVNNRRVLTGIVYVKKNGLQWNDAPRPEARPRRSTSGSSAGAHGRVCRIFVDLVQSRPDGETIMIDSTHLKVHRTAASRSNGRSGHGRSNGPRAG